MSKIDYWIYPSLMDAYQKYLDVDASTFLIQDEDGKWHRNYDGESFVLSQEECEEAARKELIRKINRVREPSQAASKGTAFNALVDSFITGVRSTEVTMRGDRANDIIACSCEGFDFMFSFSFIEEVAGHYVGSTPQVLTEAPIETRWGNVLLYGYIDELVRDRVFDLKTSKDYEFGKYKKYWQRHVYPYCLIKSGMCTKVSDFTFDCYKLTQGRAPISGTRFMETYTFDLGQSEAKIRGCLEGLTNFIEQNRSEITDTKIFTGKKS